MQEVLEHPMQEVLKYLMHGYSPKVILEFIIF